MRGDHHAALWRARHGCDVLQLTERPSIQDVGRSGITVQKFRRKRGGSPFVEHPRADENRVATRNPLAQQDSSAWIDLTRWSFWQAEDQRLWHSETKVSCDTLAGCNLQLSGAGTQRSGGRQQGSSGDRSASRNDQDTTSLVLVAIFSRLRKRYAAEKLGLIAPSFIVLRLWRQASTSQVRQPLQGE